MFLLALQGWGVSWKLPKATRRRSRWKTMLTNWMTWKESVTKVARKVNTGSRTVDDHNPVTS